MKFKEIKPDARQQLSEQAVRTRTFGEERSRWESASPGPQSVQQRRERKDSVTPQPPGRVEPEILSREPGSSVPPSPERGKPKTPSAEREPDFVPPRQVNIAGPDQVQIPPPPIVNRERGPRIFREGPPSRPADEQRTEVRSGPGKSDRARETDRNRERR